MANKHFDPEEGIPLNGIFCKDGKWFMAFPGFVGRLKSYQDTDGREMTADEIEEEAEKISGAVSKIAGIIKEMKEGKDEKVAD